MFFEVIIPFFDRLGTIDTFCDFFYYNIKSWKKQFYVKFIILICYIWMLVEV